MKKTRKLLSVLFALAIVLSMSISAFAASSSAGKYGTIRGSLIATGASTFRSTTSVLQNPDSARLYVTYDVYTDTDSRIGGTTSVSGTGATSFIDNYSSPTIYGETIDYCFGCHEVRSASGSYATYTLAYV